MNQSGSTREAGLGFENKNYSQTDIFERIQKDVFWGDKLDNLSDKLFKV